MRRPAPVRVYRDASTNAWWYECRLPLCPGPPSPPRASTQPIAVAGALDHLHRHATFGIRPPTPR